MPSNNTAANTDNKIAQKVRRWSRSLHRDLSFLFAGMVFVYALSGVFMNHRDTINPHFSVERTEYAVPASTPSSSQLFSEQDVEALLQPLNEVDNYTKHYFPRPNELKVFLKGGSSLVVDLSTRQAVYEKLTRRPLISAFTSMHYNPGNWWTVFSDCFAVALMLITLTGIIMLRGRKGIWGRGGIELLIGILIPIILYNL